MIGTRILLADDHEVVRQGVRALLEREGYDVVAEAGDGRDAIRLAQEHRPDVALLDLTMPVLNGIDAGRAIRDACPEVKLVALTEHTEDSYVLDALEAGFRGYVSKLQAVAELVKALEEVYRGSIFLSPGLSDVVVETYLGKVQLYPKVTGTAVPAGDALYAPIPAERDPAEFVEEQLNRLLGMLGGWASPPSPAWAPPVSISESESEIVVEADLPGVGRDQVTVTVHGNALVITGSRLLSRDNATQLRQNERSLGPFRRVVMMPNMRSGEPVAQMKDGVLEIRIQKDTQAVKPRQIVVNHVN